MAKVNIEEKTPPTFDILVITSETLEEKLFLSRLYELRKPPFALRENPDGSVSLSLTY